MIRNSRLNAVVVTLTVLVASLVAPVVACQAAGAEPFKISGGGIAPEGLPLPGEAPRPHWAVGLATDLGFYFGNGTVMTDTAGFHPESNGDFTGEFGSGEPFEFIGEHGNKLVCEYGRADLPVADGGATSPGTFELVLLPDGKYVAYFVAEFVSVPGECTGKFAGCSASWIMYAITEPFVLGSSDPLGYAWHGEGSIQFKN